MPEVIKHLMRLGLSDYEARAYVATVALGEGTVKEISEESGVPRSRTYDIMERLAKRGLVEMGSTTPICYRANEPLTASDHLMEEFRRANEEIVRSLHELGRNAEKRDNPVWTLTGGWAIDHKFVELLEGASREVTAVFLSQGGPLRYAKALARASEEKKVTVVLAHDPEGFLGLLGRSRVMRLRPIPGFMSDVEGTLCDKGFVTKDGRYCVETILLVDRDTTFILTREGEGHRAIIITGTILNPFGHDTVARLVRNAEDLTGDEVTS